MNSRKPLHLAALGVVLALVIALPPNARADDEVRLAAVLVGADADPGAFGEARFEMRPDRARIEFRFEAITSATTVLVGAGDQLIGGPIELDDQGRGRLRLDTQIGDDVPALREGDVVFVLNAEDFSLIVFGFLEVD